MQDITKVELKIETDYLKNKVKEIRIKKEIEMSKTTKKNEMILPNGIEAVYSGVSSLIKDLIRKEHIDYSKYFNYVITIANNIKEIPTEIDQDGIKSYLIGRMSKDLFELLKSAENKISYGIENLIKFIDDLFEMITDYIKNKVVDYSNFFSVGYRTFVNYKNIMNEFNDLDSNEVGVIAEHIAYKIIG